MSGVPGKLNYVPLEYIEIGLSWTPKTRQLAKVEPCP
jgi:hypothetical protein